MQGKIVRARTGVLFVETNGEVFFLPPRVARAAGVAEGDVVEIVRVANGAPKRVVEQLRKIVTPAQAAAPAARAAAPAARAAAPKWAELPLGRDYAEFRAAVQGGADEAALDKAFPGWREAWTSHARYGCPAYWAPRCTPFVGEAPIGAERFAHLLGEPFNAAPRWTWWHYSVAATTPDVVVAQERVGFPRFSADYRAELRCERGDLVVTLTSLRPESWGEGGWLLEDDGGTGYATATFRLPPAAAWAVCAANDVAAEARISIYDDAYAERLAPLEALALASAYFAAPAGAERAGAAVALYATALECAGLQRLEAVAGAIAFYGALSRAQWSDEAIAAVAEAVGATAIEKTKQYIRWDTTVGRVAADFRGGSSAAVYTAAWLAK